MECLDCNWFLSSTQSFLDKSFNKNDSIHHPAFSLTHSLTHTLILALNELGLEILWETGSTGSGHGRWWPAEKHPEAPCQDWILAGCDLARGSDQGGIGYQSDHSFRPRPATPSHFWSLWNLGNGIGTSTLSISLPFFHTEHFLFVTFDTTASCPFFFYYFSTCRALNCATALVNSLNPTSMMTST